MASSEDRCDYRSRVLPLCRAGNARAGALRKAGSRMLGKDIIDTVPEDILCSFLVLAELLQFVLDKAPKEMLNLVKRDFDDPERFERLVQFLSQFIEIFGPRYS